MALLIGCLISACLGAGCQSTLPPKYVSPRVEGRVVDAQTHQPIAGVTVRRLDPGEVSDPSEVPHGGQRMEQAPTVRTGHDGVFVLESERVLELFRRGGWYSVRITFEQNGYAKLTTNYTLVNATQTPSGEPLVKTGDISLTPVAR